MKDQALQKISLQNGVLLGLVLSAYSFFLNNSGLYMKSGLSMVNWLLYAGAIVWSIQLYKDANSGYMKMGKGVGLGTLVSVIAGFITSIFSILYTKVINTGFIDELKRNTIQKLEENPNITEDMMESVTQRTESWIDRMQSPVMAIVMGLLFAAILGVILSLIISAIMKKNPPEGGVPYEEETEEL